MRVLLRKYEDELRKLKQELNEKTRHLEQDKSAAINALEEKNREYIMDRDKKKGLEEKIRALNS